ncbi:hypothetical protein ACMYLX_23165, partial [Salmonella enterica subsp. enterica serovar Enteritidis]|uniref:hypothetical protein n=1 Tax=Salmonella enterica TaxID=28901 RepID=UPI0039E7B3C9
AGDRRLGCAVIFGQDWSPDSLCRHMAHSSVLAQRGGLRVYALDSKPLVQSLLAMEARGE